MEHMGTLVRLGARRRYPQNLKLGCFCTHTMATFQILKQSLTAGALHMLPGYQLAVCVTYGLFCSSWRVFRSTHQAACSMSKNSHMHALRSFSQSQIADAC